MENNFDDHLEEISSATPAATRYQQERDAIANRDRMVHLAGYALAGVVGGGLVGGLISAIIESSTLIFGLVGGSMLGVVGVALKEREKCRQCWDYFSRDTSGEVRYKATGGNTTNLSKIVPINDMVEAGRDGSVVAISPRGAETLSSQSNQRQTI